MRELRPWQGKQRRALVCDICGGPAQVWVTAGGIEMGAPGSGDLFIGANAGDDAAVLSCHDHALQEQLRMTDEGAAVASADSVQMTWLYWVTHYSPVSSAASWLERWYDPVGWDWPTQPIQRMRVLRWAWGGMSPSGSGVCFTRRGAERALRRHAALDPSR